MRMPIANGFGTTLLTNLAIQACGVITGVLTARLLGPEGKGELAAVLLWPSLLAAVGLFGLNWALARQAGRQPAQMPALARIGIVWGFAGGVVFMFLGWWLLPWLLGGDKEHLLPLGRLYLLFIPINFIGLNLIGLDQGASRFGRYNLARFVLYPTYLLGVLLIWYSGSLEVFWFVLANLTASCFAVGLRVALMERTSINEQPAPDIYRLILRDTIPFGIAAAVSVVNRNVDQALTVLLLNPAHVGLYAVALTFASVHSLFAAAFGIVSFASTAGEKSREAEGNVLARTTRQAALLYTIVTPTVVGLAPWLIVPLFGQSFAAAVGPCMLLTLATSVAAHADILNQGLRGAGRPNPGVIAQCLGAIAMVMIGWLFVRSLGLFGIALGATISAVMQWAILLYTSSRWFGITSRSFWLWDRHDLQAFIRFKKLTSLGSLPRTET